MTAIFLFAFFFLATTTNIGLAQDADPEFVVKVVDEMGQPIANASIHKSHVWKIGDEKFPNIDNQDYSTNSGGSVKWKLPGDSETLRVWAHADGFVPMIASWEREQLAGGETIPAKFAFTLTKGTKIGGIVVDYAGKPISGVRVDVSCKAEIRAAGRQRLNGLLAHGDKDDVDGAAAETNENGEWSINNAPNNKAATFTVSLRHPDYINDDDVYRNTATDRTFTFDSLHSQSEKLVLLQGVALKGKAIDADGNPAERGIVVLGDDPLSSGKKAIVELDELGEFEFPPTAPGEHRLTVVVPGFAPQTRMVEVNPMMDELSFELKKGKAITILVVDGDHKPIPGAFVQLVRWRDTEALYNTPHPRLPNSHVPIRVDEGGLFQWNWAPSDEITYSIGMPGYVGQHDIKLAPSSEIHVIKLSQPLKLKGTVVNKADGEKLKQFAAIPIQYETKDAATGRERRSEVVVGRNGRFKAEIGRDISDADKWYALKIESSDYATFVTKRYRMGQEVERLKIELEPQTWPTSRVLDLEGNPLAEVSVKIASNSQTVRTNSYRIEPAFGEQTFSTDVRGQFKIPPTDEPFSLFVIDVQGYAEATFQSSSELKDIKLVRWAKLNGQVFDVDNNPVADMPVTFNGNRIGHGRHGNIQDNTMVMTDASGKFEFPRLPPIRGQIRTLGNNDEANRSSFPVHMKSAETANVEIGKGIKLHGTIKLTPTENIELDYRSTHTMIAPIEPPKFGYPDGVAKASEYDWKSGWTGYLKMVDKGSIFPPDVYQKSMTSYTAKPDANGNFAINVATPGEYEMTIQISASHKENPGSQPGSAGNQILKFTIDEGAKNKGEMDLGMVEVEANRSPEFGTVVEDFEFSIQNETNQLANFRGKFVLLDFWISTCEVCKADNSKLKDFAINHEDNDLLSIVSLTQDLGRGFSRPTQTSANWHEGIMDYQTRMNTLRILGIWSAPRYLVIDPEGRLIFHGTLDGSIDHLSSQLNN